MTIDETIKMIDKKGGWWNCSPSDIRNLNNYCKRLKSENEQLILSGVSSMLILTPKDAEVFFNEIMNPKEANKALKKAMLKFITR